MANISADQNPAIANPGTMIAASIIKRAFITRENRPSVSIFTGSVSTKIRGFMKRLMTARTTASINAPTSVVAAPGIRYEVISIAIVETSHCVMFIFYLFILNKFYYLYIILHSFNLFCDFFPYHLMYFFSR